MVMMMMLMMMLMMIMINSDCSGGCGHSGESIILKSVGHYDRDDDIDGDDISPTEHT